MTEIDGAERKGSDEQAKCQRQASEVPAFATQSLQGMGSDASESVANLERQESNVVAMKAARRGRRTRK